MIAECTKQRKRQLRSGEKDRRKRFKKVWWPLQFNRLRLRVCLRELVRQEELPATSAKQAFTHMGGLVTAVLNITTNAVATVHLTS